MLLYQSMCFPRGISSEGVQSQWLNIIILFEKYTYIRTHAGMNRFIPDMA